MPQKNWIFYDDYGRIIKAQTSIEEWAEDNKQEGENLMEVPHQISPDNYYVSGGTVLQRVPFPDVSVTESPTINSTITVSNVPDNTEVIWPDEIRTRESASFTFETDVGGRFDFWLIAAAHPMKKVSIDVAS